MYRKAEQFNDSQSKQQLLKETDPKVCKGIGRAVKNFDKAVWDRISYDVSVYRFISIIIFHVFYR